MGQFTPGDVVIAPVRFEEGYGTKVRPVVIVMSAADGWLTVCPVSTRKTTDQVIVPLSLDDFREGGLDMFEESFVYPCRVQKIEGRDVIGKRGRLSAGVLGEIAGKIPGQAIGKKKRP